MKVFKETIDESARRISEWTLIFCLFFAFVGTTMIITQRFTMGWEFLGTYWVDEGPIVAGVGVSLTVWSFLTLWICYFRRARRVLPYMRSQIIWFLILVGFCLTVSVLPVFIYMPRVYRMISLGSLIVLFISAHFFHKRVRSAVSKLIKQREDGQQDV
jgi:membrane associated rhomboid family serine protease